MIAVINSSPWIFLSGLVILEDAVDLFDELIVPQSVYEEILQKQDLATDLLVSFHNTKLYTICRAENLRLLNALNRRLGKGESEAIAIALEKQTDMVLLDDHAARAEALRLGLDVKGTLGVIRKLMDLKKYECDTEELYGKLQRLNFRVSREIFDSIFKLE